MLPDLAAIINPVYERPIESYKNQVFDPFAICVLIMSIPVFIGSSCLCMILMGLDSFAIKAFKRFELEKMSLTIAGLVFIFSVGFMGSFFYTLISGSIGTFYYTTGTPITFQLIIWNSIFDGATLYATVYLLKWATASWRCRGVLDELDASLIDLVTSMDENDSLVDRKSKSREVLEENVDNISLRALDLDFENNPRVSYESVSYTHLTLPTKA